MEEKIEVAAFLKLLKQKTRDIVYTRHSIVQARKRNLIGAELDKIDTFESDIQNTPYLVVEQVSEHPDERKFKVFYRSPVGGFLCYVFALDGQIRVITARRETKSLQKKIFKIEKEKGYR